MTIILIRAVILYALIIFAIRLMGKRQIGELQPSELVITILVSNIATLPIEDSSLPMAMGIVPILALVCLDVIMSGISMKSRRIRRIISGSPKIIIKDGKIDQKQMKLLRFTIDDLMESLHEYNIFDIREVQFAVVETTGKISVYQKYSQQNVTAEMLGIKGKEENPPVIVIDDGVIIENALSPANIGIERIGQILLEKKLKVQDVFLMTVNNGGDIFIIQKD